MYIFRRALLSDLPSIYNLQNVASRTQTLIFPLLPYDSFLKETEARLKSGHIHYYILEKDTSPVGFAQFQKISEIWGVLTWGKQVSTLAYASGKVAFEDLQLPKLTFAVRRDLKWLTYFCEKFQFRKVRQGSLCYRPHALSLITIVHLNYYEISAEEFREKSSFLREQASELVFSKE